MGKSKNQGPNFQINTLVSLHLQQEPMRIPAPPCWPGWKDSHKGLMFRASPRDLQGIRLQVSFWVQRKLLRKPGDCILQLARSLSGVRPRRVGKGQQV